jgi:hypothetical protein
MSNRLEWRYIWGGLLILAGVVFLLQNFGFIGIISDLFWALLLGAAGVFFLTVFAQNRAHWWALIPGFTLLSIAFLIVSSQLVPGFSDVWGGSLVLGGIGASFLVIYLLERRSWWALIPAGVMLTLAVIAGLGSLLPGLESGGILFLGMGATFALVALLPNPQGQLKWAWIPAGILLFMGLVFVAAAGNIVVYILPLALIIGGGYLILRTFFPRHSD